MNKILMGVAVLVILVGAGFIVQRSFFRGGFDLPEGGETVKETIVIRDGEVIGIEDGVQTENIDQMKKDGQFFETKEIMITDGVKHSIPLEELLGGGPPKDGIPSIDNPKFITTGEADKWLSDDEPGIAFSLGNTNRFYPYQIMVWHEIVNDTVEGRRVLITYCPLCLTGFVFDPVVKGERVEFGTSGKLWKSNLVMYDRKTDSLWPQVLGEAVVGEMTGTKLKTLSSDQVLYSNWKKLFPNGEVLSRETGANRFYGSSPYGDYFSVTNLSLSLVNPTDTRLPNDAFVFGIVIKGKAKAYSTEAVKAKGEVKDSFQDTSIVLRYDKELDVVRMFKVSPDGSEERINPFSSFWFSWAAAHPDTELYK
ncbi:MAG: DUF3179 domain-containing protein [Patescibacteria group bacterium]|nr:DUF3179 domain-containing protein [Patescibacteria group bacterium]